MPQAVTSLRGCSWPRAEPLWAQPVSDCSPVNCPCPWGQGSKKKVLQLQCSTPRTSVGSDQGLRFQMLQLGRQDTHWVAFHLLPQDDCTDVPGEGPLLRGGMWTSKAIQVSCLCLPVGLAVPPFSGPESRVIPKSSRDLFIF